MHEDDEDDDNADIVDRVEVMDDDYDEEAPDDDDDDDPHGAGLIIREGRRGGPANDIINLNPNQPQRVNRHEFLIGWRHPGRPDRIGGAG